MVTYGRWIKKRVLITVRTYPMPSKQQIEVSCTAGIDEDGKWIRIFPVPYRFLNFDSRFTKYQYIEANVTKSFSDPRLESYKVNPETIKLISAQISESNQWEARKEKIFPLKSHSLCELQSLRDANQYPTLGFFKPKEITRLHIKPDAPDWTESQLMRLRQYPLFGKTLKSELVKIPFEFSYTFRCDDPYCRTHKLSCTDWEMGASYLSWRNKYNDKWEDKFRETYDDNMRLVKDTHFFVGTIREHPSEWIIIGLFYPQKSDSNQPKLL